MSDQQGPPPGVDPSAWSRWLERRGQPLPRPVSPRSDAAPAPEADSGHEAQPATALDELRRRVEAARAAEGPVENIAVDVDELAALIARVDRLVAALSRYGQHALHCASRGGPARGETTRPCTCGLDAELAGQ